MIRTTRTTERRKRPEIFGHNHGLRLRGKVKTEQRRKLFERSKGRCEARVWWGEWKRCTRQINDGTYDPTSNPFGMEWSHNRHAANKCDCLECGIASCHECHMRSHNCGGKPIQVTKKSLKVTA